MKKEYSHIFWDWNGTLLNDVDWNIKITNEMLQNRQMAIFGNLDEYRDVFGFPIIDYYRKIGFDFADESFEEISTEYIERYHAQNTGSCGLYENAESVIRKIKENGLTQVILTAAKTENLLFQIRDFNISHYFDDMLGLGDIQARSKIDVGLNYIRNNPVKKALMIGDSVHDFEVSQALGADCLLLATGHQSRKVLEKCGMPILGDISEVLGYISF